MTDSMRIRAAGKRVTAAALSAAADGVASGQVAAKFGVGDGDFLGWRCVGHAPYPTHGCSHAV